MGVIAKRKMPASIVGDFILEDGWPTTTFREYAEKVAIKWGVHEDNVESAYYVYTHPNDEMVSPGKDAYVIHALKQKCHENKMQTTLCIRVTKRGKTVVLAEHSYGSCPRITRVTGF